MWAEADKREQTLCFIYIDIYTDRSSFAWAGWPARFSVYPSKGLMTHACSVVSLQLKTIGSCSLRHFKRSLEICRHSNIYRHQVAQHFSLWTWRQKWPFFWHTFDTFRSCSTLTVWYIKIGDWDRTCRAGNCASSSVVPDLLWNSAIKAA